MEIERKFLVSSIPGELSVGERVRQGYVTITPDGSELRVRERVGVHTLTVKSGSGQIRNEYEAQIDESLFLALWPLTDGRRVEKYRYDLPFGKHVIELDVFEGQLAGIVVAEVEFPDEATANDFVAPEWFGEEVTEDPAYRNQTLASSKPAGFTSPK